MFRNLLPKEVFTRLSILFVHDEECLPTVGSIYSFFLFVVGNYGEYKSSPLCEGQRMTMNITLGFFFSLFIYTMSPSQLGFL